MKSFIRLMLVALAAVQLTGPSAVHAAQVRAVSCTVAIDYLFNDVLRAPYQKTFVVDPGAVFEDDFSTFTRFRIFDAWTHLDETGNTVVEISYFNDVGVFDSIDLRTRLTLHEDAETISGSHSYFTSQGVAGERTTNHTLTCSRLKR